MCTFIKGRNLQYVSSLLVSIFSATSFMAILWSSPIGPILESNETPLNERIDKQDEVLMYSILMLGSILGNVCIGLLIDNLGKKGTLLFTCVPIFISWIMIYFAKNFIVVLVARFIMGTAVAVPINVAVMYIGEISEVSIRGKLSIFSLLAAELGAVITLTVGPVSYHALAFIGILLPVLAFASFWFMPETPYYYLTKKKYKEAELSLIRLRDTEDVSEEFKQLSKSVEDTMSNKARIGDIFGNKAYKKAFFIVLGLKTIKEMSGGYFIQAHMSSIFEAANTGLDNNTQSLICTVVPFPFMLGGSFVIDKFGRKMLLYISTLGTAAAMLLESIYFFMKDFNTVTPAMSFMPVTGILLAYIFKAVGLGSISVLIMTELFPVNIKGLASALILVYGSVLGTVLSFAFLYIVKLIGAGSCFVFFAICCLVGYAFVWGYIPETKGKSLGEIHKELEM